MENNFDLVIIGAGPAGYTGAIRATQLGMKVACIEKDPTLGGTCLNVGCIPSKALLHFSEKYEEALKHLASFGINTSCSLDLATMIAKKDKVVSDLTRGIEMLFNKNKIHRISGTAKITSPNTVLINNQTEITTRNILIATGSIPAPLPNISLDHKRIVSSTGALSLKEVPQKLIVIGAGYIGLELGSVWRRLGSEVLVLEYSNNFLPFMDKEVATTLYNSLQKQGMQFQMSTKVLSAQNQGDKVLIKAQKDNIESELDADIVLVAAGRVPYTTDLGLEELGIEKDNRGFITVDNFYRTRHPSVYAVGDVIPGPMLAHKAEGESIDAVEIMNGKKPSVNYNLIPSVIYTSPEVASVGATEEQLKASSKDYKIGKFPFMANSKAKAILSTEGFVKILADSKTDQILGAHIIGQNASNLISELAVAMEFKASSQDIALTMHPHPTLSEAICEAAKDVNKEAINI